MKSIRNHVIDRRSFMAMLGVCLLPAIGVNAEPLAPKFKVTLKESHVGELEVDTRLLDSYGKLDSNIRQFYLDARAAFKASSNANFTCPEIVNAAKNHRLALMGGPMLGDLRADGVAIWLRPAESTPLTVKVAKSGGAVFKSYQVKSVNPGVELKVKLEGLSPKTAYSYAVYAKDRRVAAGEFTTAPDDNEKGRFRITFGSCFHKIGLHNPNLFGQILKRRPSAMLLLGDIAVDDRNNHINMHRADYQLRDVSKPWREFTAKVPVYAVWDDHDYFDNDRSGIPKKFTSADRDAVRAVWPQNWNNPPADDGREGIYFSTRIGPVEVIMLDTRSCRDNKRRNEYGSYLGQKQMEWLKDTLKKSTAPFKIISSGTMWSDYVSKAKDSWGSWDVKAREEIFSLIEQENISGVLLISGDRHGARGFRIPRKPGYDFLEFEAATLGGVQGPAGLLENCPEQLFGYHGRDLIAFGEFTFDTTLNPPQVTFRLVRETGEIMEEHVMDLKASSKPPNIKNS